MAQDIRKRDTASANITRYLGVSLKLKIATTTKEEVETRVMRLNQFLHDFETYQDKIDEVTGEAEMPYQSIEREKTDEAYIACMSNLNLILHSFSPSEQPIAPIHDHNQIKLPTINLPEFSGKYQDWPPFSNLFRTLIHSNVKLSMCQKFHYLKSNLSGEAEELIKNFQITDENYVEAWNLLENRYNNKGFIVDSHLEILLNMPKINTESAANLRSIRDKAYETVRALKTLGIPTEHWDVILVFIVASKLDKETSRQWALSRPRTELPKFDDIIEFLDRRWQCLEMVPGATNRLDTTTVNKKQLPSKQNQKTTLAHYGESGRPTPVCNYCKESHYLNQCPRFLAQSYESKTKFVKDNSLCFNCLKFGHSSQRCTSKSFCRKCNSKHNTSLHNESRNIQSTSTSTSITAPRTNNELESKPQAATSSPSTVAVPTTSAAIGLHSAYQSSGQVLLSTALIIIKHRNNEHIVRALIDSGSTATFISTKLVRQLGLKEHHSSINVSGLGASFAGKSTSRVDITISSLHNKKFTTNVTALTMDKITSTLPIASFNSSSFYHLSNLNLADPKYNIPGQIDILLGADVYATILLNDVVKGPHGTPVAQNTHLGWILFGQINEKSLETNNYCNIVNLHLQSDPLETILKQFWEVEELSKDRLPTIIETQCEESFETTYQQNENGRIIVHLPFKSSRGELGNSRDAAIHRLKQMEKRFRGKPDLKSQYVSFMNEYLQLNHMELIPQNEVDIPFNHSFYLPHHAVIREHSTTTKLRVVFDGSMKTNTGNSVNDIQMVGPTLQQDLVSIILRWKKHKIVFVADIEKMYRQVLVHKPHTDFQRIVWRESENEEIKDFRLLTVTYGTSSAPYLAIKAMRQLATNHQNQFSLGSSITLRDFYVDDVLSGSNTLSEAMEAHTQLTQLLSIGGFNLRKWRSNNQEFLNQLPTDHLATTLAMAIDSNEAIKTLGVRWCPATDTFEFNCQPFSSAEQTTKRTLLSDVAKLFDPLGWLAPTIIKAKIMFQQLWLAGISWDDRIPHEIETEWVIFKNQLQIINSIRIDRWFGYTGDCEQLEIHGFSDASNLAYAAVVYARTITPEGVKINILASKTKVSPIKVISLPRLELCGALLLARLLKKVIQAIECPGVNVFAWTDSSIVLAWIQKSPIHWKTFVANRITEIQTLTSPAQWRYIESGENPADCASRGLYPAQLESHPLWWTGPSWIQSSHEQWPQHKLNMDTSLESRTTAASVIVNAHSTTDFDLLGRFSTLSKLINITGYCLRFISNIKRKIEQQQLETRNYITVTERRDAFEVLVKIAQNSDFNDDISRCSTDDVILRKSRLLSLSPFLDSKGILRVGGRLRQANIQFNQRHPIILSKHNNLSNLLIADAHKTTLHGGPRQMMAFLQQNFWILGVRDATRTYSHKSTTCFRERARTQQQLMGDLPSVRITPARAFLHSGVDYAGPISLKLLRGRGGSIVKGYIALFICLVTKAIHLEVVSDLTTNGFMAAYRRFISRRGKCTDLYSDRGTNFVGANRIMDTNHRKASAENEELEKLLADDGTNWHFIPPASPHFGGLWEAGVKSCKTHLRKITGNSNFTFEEMATLLAQIEAVLNSRPLCPLSNNVDDLNVLTPGHFLIGDSLIVSPEPSLLEVNITYLPRWQQMQKRLHEFWKIWSMEYLTRLQQRPKWSPRQENIQLGQLILIKDERLPPAKWQLGRIIATHPGHDGLVRVVTVRRNGHEGRLAITKICALPVSSPFSIEDTSTRAEC